MPATDAGRSSTAFWHPFRFDHVPSHRLTQLNDTFTEPPAPVALSRVRCKLRAQFWRQLAPAPP